MSQNNFQKRLCKSYTKQSCVFLLPYYPTYWCGIIGNSKKRNAVLQDLRKTSF